MIGCPTSSDPPPRRSHRSGSPIVPAPRSWNRRESASSARRSTGTPPRSTPSSRRTQAMPPPGSRARRLLLSGSGGAVGASAPAHLHHASGVAGGDEPVDVVGGSMGERGGGRDGRGGLAIACAASDDAPVSHRDGSATMPRARQCDARRSGFVRILERPHRLMPRGNDPGAFAPPEHQRQRAPHLALLPQPNPAPHPTRSRPQHGVLDRAASAARRSCRARSPCRPACPRSSAPSESALSSAPLRRPHEVRRVEPHHAA